MNHSRASSDRQGLVRAVGLGLITGAADDDPSAIGTYASAGAGIAFICLQIWASYTFIRNVFRALALALLAYVPAAILAHPDWASVLKATLVPTVRFNGDFLSMAVAVIGTTLSAYLYTWQSNEEVEEEKAAGRVLLSQRRGATEQELKRSRRDVLFGMFFSNLAMYFIILATATTLFKAGKTDIDTAAKAAQSLAPIAGNAAKVLFALGVIGVGFLAVPVMTTGAAYDLCQTIGWKWGLGNRPRQAKRFYGAIAFFTLVGAALNFIGVNPMKALVVAGIVQGFSTPPLMLLIMLMTNNRNIMGENVNGRGINILGWITTAIIFAATIALVVAWMI